MLAELHSPLVKAPIPCLLPGYTSSPITCKSFHQAHIEHSFIVISCSGRTKRMVPDDFELLGGFHSSWASSRTENPPPWDIDEIKVIDSDVKLVPKSRCDEWVKRAVWRRRILVNVRIALAIAVCVGRAEMYVRSLWAASDVVLSEIVETKRSRIDQDEVEWSQAMKRTFVCDICSSI